MKNPIISQGYKENNVYFDFFEIGNKNDDLQIKNKNQKFKIKEILESNFKDKII